MRSTTARRAIAAAGCAVLGAAMVVVGAEPATAHSGGTRTVEGSAIGSLATANGALGVILSVFDPPGQDAFAGVEILGSTATSIYECLDGPRIDAELARLQEAEADGRTTLLCGGPDLPPEGVIAYVTVDVEWDGFGGVAHDRSTVDGCRVTTAIRQADVSGRITVRIPALDVKAYLTEGSGDLRRTTTICPGPRG